MQTETKPRFYLPELDGLRFIAFLLVFVHHAPYYVHSSVWRKIHEYGWIGVDLFLCLSAFLITQLLYKEYKENSRINIRNFYIRRILRIWPLYLFMIVLGTLIYAEQNGWNTISSGRILGLVTFTDNVVSAIFGYIPIFYIVQLWTISYEQQLYVVIPWILRAFWQSTRKNIAMILCLVGVVGNLIRVVFIYYDVRHPAIWVLPITHFETVISGIILGLGMIDEWLSKFSKSRLFFLGLLSITSVYTLPNWNATGWGLMLTYPLSGIGMLLLIYSIVGNTESFIGKILSHCSLAFLGKISYGLYVYHILGLYLGHNLSKVLGITSEKLLIYPLGMILLGLPITVLISVLSYFVIEKPFLELKTRFTSIASRPN